MGVTERDVEFVDIGGLALSELLPPAGDESGQLRCIRIHHQGRLLGAVFSVWGKDAHRYVAELRNLSIDIALEQLDQENQQEVTEP